MAKEKSKKVVYREPDNYIPKEIRKKVGIGEYSNKKTSKKK